MSIIVYAQIVEFIISSLNDYAEFKGKMDCMASIHSQISNNLNRSMNRYENRFSGEEVKFYAIFDTANCNFIGIELRKQTIRKKQNRCSVNDKEIKRDETVLKPQHYVSFPIYIYFLTDKDRSDWKTNSKYQLLKK